MMMGSRLKWSNSIFNQAPSNLNLLRRGPSFAKVRVDGRYPREEEEPSVGNE